MSYIAHDFDVQGANRADAGSLTAANLFGKLEMAVIALARTEPASSAGQPGRVRRLFGRLFSLPPANGLANERLETLRRAVITARRQGEAAARQLLPDLYRYGFTRLQGEALLAQAVRR
jgi:hypothetical protein